MPGSSDWTTSLAYGRTVTGVRTAGGLPNNPERLTDNVGGSTRSEFGAHVTGGHTYYRGWGIDLGARFVIDKVTAMHHSGALTGANSAAGVIISDIAIADFATIDLTNLLTDGSWADDDDGWGGAGGSPTHPYTWTFDSTQTGQYLYLFNLHTYTGGLAFHSGFAEVEILVDGEPFTVPPEPPIIPGPVFSVDGVAFDNLLEARVRFEDNAPGAGYMVLSRDDPQAIPAMVYRGAVVQCTFPEIHPDPLFEFYLEEGDFDAISSDEEGGEELAFGGPGTLSILRRAIVRSEEFLDGTGEPKPNRGVWVFADGVTEGHILNKLVREAQAAGRPAHPLAGMTRTFDSDDDSNGNPWNSEPLQGKWRVKIGTSIYDAAQRLVNSGLMHIEMYPGLVLYARRNRGVDRSSNSFASGKIVFVKGTNIVDELSKGLAGQHFATHAEVKYVDNDDDIHYVNATKDAGDFSYDKEIYLEVEANHKDTAKRQAKHAMKLREDLQDAIEFAHAVPWPGKEDGDPDSADITGKADELNGWYLPGPAWTDHGSYWLGDLVTLHTGTGSSEFEWNKATKRVYAITLYKDATGYLAPPIVELNAPRRKHGHNRVMSGISGTLSDTGSGGGTGGGGGGGGSGPGPISLGGYQPLAEKGDPDGYASLDEDGHIPTGQLAGGAAAAGYVGVSQGDGTVEWQPSAGAPGAGEPVEVIDPATGTISTIDYEVARVWDLVLSGNVVIDDILNPPPSGLKGEVWINVYGNGTHTVTAYPASFEWSDADGVPTATPPTLYMDAGSRNPLHGITHDGGVTWGFALENAATTGGGPPTGSAGGDLSGSYPNPSVVDDSHAHTLTTLPTLVVAAVWVVDGGASAITTGVKGDLQIPFGCTITRWSILLNASGSIVFDIWKDTEANYPPVVGDSITAAAKPTVSGATKASSGTLTGWTTSVTAGDTLRFNVDSITTATRATLTLYATRT